MEEIIRLGTVRYLVLFLCLSLTHGTKKKEVVGDNLKKKSEMDITYLFLGRINRLSDQKRARAKRLNPQRAR